MRLVVPGFQGVCNVKFLASLKVVDEAYDMQREISAYTNTKPNGMSSWFESQVGPKSLITFPSDAHKLPGPGVYEISSCRSFPRRGRGSACPGSGTEQRQ